MSVWRELAYLLCLERSAWEFESPHRHQNKRRVLVAEYRSTISTRALKARGFYKPFPADYRLDMVWFHTGGPLDNGDGIEYYKKYGSLDRYGGGAGCKPVVNSHKVRLLDDPPWKNIYASVGESGVPVSLSRRRSRVQIPSGAPYLVNYGVVLFTSYNTGWWFLV